MIPFAPSFDADELATLTQLLSARNLQMLAWAVDTVRYSLDGYQLAPETVLPLKQALRHLIWSPALIQDEQTALRMAVAWIEAQFPPPVEMLAVPTGQDQL